MNLMATQQGHIPIPQHLMSSHDHGGSCLPRLSFSDRLTGLTKYAITCRIFQMHALFYHVVRLSQYWPLFALPIIGELGISSLSR